MQKTTPEGLLGLAPAGWARWVAGLSTQEFVLFTLLGSIATLASLYFLFRFFHRARIIEDTPTSRVRSAAQGYVELEGHGELMEGPPITAPLSGKICLWYRYRIDERDNEDDNETATWEQVESGTSDELFHLVDDTGKCIIDPEGAEVTTNTRDVWYGRSRKVTGTVENSSGLLSSIGSPYRYTEERLMPGDTLYAIGFFTSVRQVNPTHNPREAARDLLRVWKKDRHGLTQRFDSNQDGKIDQQEWNEARRQARKQVMHESVTQPLPQSLNMLVKPDNSRYPYLLSVRSQDSLATRLRLYAAGMFVLFMSAGIFVTGMIAIRAMH
jgi:hypothetical protein